MYIFTSDNIAFFASFENVLKSHIVECFREIALLDVALYIGENTVSITHSAMNHRFSKRGKLLCFILLLPFIVN